MQSMEISGNQWQPEVTCSDAINGNQWQSLAISGNQWHSEVTCSDALADEH